MAVNVTYRSGDTKEKKSEKKTPSVRNVVVKPYDPKPAKKKINIEVFDKVSAALHIHKK